MQTTVDEANQKIKAAQKAMWAAGSFNEIARNTLAPAADLTNYARIAPGERVLDVGTGTGNVAITAAARGAHVTGIDLTPELLVHARTNASLVGAEVEWQEGDAEALPFPDDSFDVVVSQFGHMFAPRPKVAAEELVRVTRPGGRIAISTWPPDDYVGRMFALNARYNPPPPGVASPLVWGTAASVRDLMGPSVRDLQFRSGVLRFQCLGPAQYRNVFETHFGPIVRLVDMLKGDPKRLQAWRNELDALVAQYFEDNHVRQEFLMARAVKA